MSRSGPLEVALELLGQRREAGGSRHFLEPTQVSRDGRVDKHKTVCSCSGLIFSLKKECSAEPCYDMGESGKHSVHCVIYSGSCNKALLSECFNTSDLVLMCMYAKKKLSG